MTISIPYDANSVNAQLSLIILSTRKKINNTIRAVQTEQYTYEINAWLRTLDYLQQENIYMKNRIADVIQHTASTDVLEKMEHYQNFFLNKDTVITFLRRDIRELEKRKNGELPAMMKTLRSDMEMMEKEFSHLKTDFNNYMQAVI
jgi:FtsZ-binding cell division protein ZapB